MKIVSEAASGDEKFPFARSARYNDGVQPGRVSTSIELPRDLFRKIHEIAGRQGCSAQQLILKSIEVAVAAASRQRPKERLSLDEPLVPPTGGPINPTEEQIYGGIEFP